MIPGGTGVDLGGVTTEGDIGGILSEGVICDDGWSVGSRVGANLGNICGSTDVDSNVGMCDVNDGMCISIGVGLDVGICVGTGVGFGVGTGVGTGVGIGS